MGGSWLEANYRTSGFLSPSVGPEGWRPPSRAGLENFPEAAAHSRAEPQAPHEQQGFHMNMCELRGGSRGRAEAAGSERRAQRRRPGEYPPPDRLPSPGARTGGSGPGRVRSRTRAEAETGPEEGTARGSCPHRARRELAAHRQGHTSPGPRAPAHGRRGAEGGAPALSPHPVTEMTRVFRRDPRTLTLSPHPREMESSSPPPAPPSGVTPTQTQAPRSLPLRGKEKGLPGILSCKQTQGRYCLALHL